MKIRQVMFTPGKSAFFFDDQRAIKKGAKHDGFAYRGKPVTAGFPQIRVAGECISVMLVLEDGQIAVGDCASVQYSGAGGRDPLFQASRYMPLLRRVVCPMLEGAKVEPFRKMAAGIEDMRIKGRPLHTSLRYGLSQALLHARALASGRLMCEVVAEEFGVPVIARRVPVFAQTGDNRHDNADKMILKQADVMPHGLINNIDEKFGRRGEKLQEYISWLVRRISDLRVNPRYRPVLHLDIYGTAGLVFNYNLQRIADYLAGLEKYAGGLNLYIEGPVDMEEKSAQIAAMKSIRERLEIMGSSVKIVADEWCNTFEDIIDFTEAEACHMVQIKTPVLGGIQNVAESVLYCRGKGMEAYQGGSCNETDISARVCVHVAMAVRADRMLAKPGMGFDEGYTVVNNEMERIITILKNRGKKS